MLTINNFEEQKLREFEKKLRFLVEFRINLTKIDTWLQIFSKKLVNYQKILPLFFDKNNFLRFKCIKAQNR